MTEEVVNDLAKILSNDSLAANIKYQAIENLLDLTGTQDGRDFLLNAPILFKCMSKLIKDNKLVICTSVSLKFFVNFTSIESFKFDTEILPDFKLLLEWCLDKENIHSQLCSFILSNCSRSKDGAAHILKVIDENDGFMKGLVDAYCNENFNKQKQVQ